MNKPSTALPGLFTTNDSMKYKNEAHLRELKLWHGAGYNKGSCALGLECSDETILQMTRRLDLPKFGHKSLPRYWMQVLNNRDAGIAPNLLNGFHRCRRALMETPSLTPATLKLFFLNILDEATLTGWRDRILEERRVLYCVRGRAIKLRTADRKAQERKLQADKVSEKLPSISDTPGVFSLVNLGLPV